MSSVVGSSTSAGGGSARTFTVTHRQEENTADNYLGGGEGKTVPFAALRQSALPAAPRFPLSTNQPPPAPPAPAVSGSGGRCPLGFGGNGASDLPPPPLSGSGGRCPLGFGGNGASDMPPPPAVSGSGGRCPLGFGGNGSSTLLTKDQALPAMSLAALARHDGSSTFEGMPALVSVRGVVLDVTAAAKEGGMFADGGMFGSCAGHDVSRFLAVRCDEPLASLDQGLAGLTFEDQLRLDDAFRMLRARFPAVARLEASDAHRLFGGPPASAAAAACPAPAVNGTVSAPRQPAPVAGPPSASASVASAPVMVNWPLVLERSLALHEAIEHGDKDGVAAALYMGLDDESLRAKVAAMPCARTGLPPLHKALAERRGGNSSGGGAEGDGAGTGAALLGVEVLALLLASGADPAANVDLYDGDDASGIAKRFGRLADLEAALVALGRGGAKKGQSASASSSTAAAASVGACMVQLEAPAGVEVIDD